METFPNEVWNMILEHLPLYQQRMALMRVSKTFRFLDFVILQKEEVERMTRAPRCNGEHCNVNNLDIIPDAIIHCKADFNRFVKIILRRLFAPREERRCAALWRYYNSQQTYLEFRDHVAKQRFVKPRSRHRILNTMRKYNAVKRKDILDFLDPKENRRGRKKMTEFGWLMKLHEEQEKIDTLDNLEYIYSL